MKHKIIDIITKNTTTLLFYIVLVILTMQELSVWYKGGDLWSGQDTPETKALMIILLLLGISTIITRITFQIIEIKNSTKQ